MAEMSKRTVYLQLSFRNRAGRALWRFVWLVFFRPTPRVMHSWRCFLLRAFGARLGKGVHPYPSAQVWAPWNLEMGNNSCLGENVDCYSVDSVTIGSNSTVSQYSFICTASHDYGRSDMPLVTAPVVIGENVWVAADVFIAPGVHIEDGVVVTARSSVFSNLPAWTVCGGAPALPKKTRRFLIIER